MVRYLLFILVCCGLASSDSVHAKPNDNFVVAAVTTELQQESIWTRASVYAEVHCNPMIFIDKLNRDSFDQDRFVQKLVDATNDRDHLLIMCRYQFPLKADSTLVQEVGEFVKDVAERAGYRKVTVTWMETSQEWQTAYRWMTSFEEPDDATETQFEDDFVRVSPIRTKLSRFLFPECDCVVRVLKSIDGRTEELSPELIESIRKGVQSVNLSAKGILLYQLRYTESGKQNMEDLYFKSAPTQSPALLLTRGTGVHWNSQQLFVDWSST